MMKRIGKIFALVIMSLCLTSAGVAGMPCCVPEKAPASESSMPCHDMAPEKENTLDVSSGACMMACSLTAAPLPSMAATALTQEFIFNHEPDVSTLALRSANYLLEIPPQLPS